MEVDACERTLLVYSSRGGGGDPLSRPMQLLRGPSASVHDADGEGGGEVVGDLRLVHPLVVSETLADGSPHISRAGQPPRAFDGGGSYEMSTASYDSSDGSLITVQKAWSDGQMPLGVATCAG